MALRAHVEVELVVAIGGTGAEVVTAAAYDFDFPVLRVDFCLHVYTRKTGRKAEQDITSDNAGPRPFIEVGRGLVFARSRVSAICYDRRRYPILRVAT